MYRRERSVSLRDPRLVTSRGLFMILPDYLYKNEEILRDLLNETITVIDKRNTRMEREDVKAWEVEEGRGKWPEIQEGPTLVVLVEGLNLYDKIARIAKYHNESAKRRHIGMACYSSANYLDGQRDLSFFFPSLIERCDELKDADSFLVTRILPSLNEALAELTVIRPSDPLLWLADRLHDLSFSLTNENEKKEEEKKDEI